jgi:hypothetical protein
VASAERSWGLEAGLRCVEAVFGPLMHANGLWKGPARVRRCSLAGWHVLRGVATGRRMLAVSHGGVTRSRVGP